MTSHDAAVLVSLAQRWTDMWNGDLATTAEFIAPAFAIEFGAVMSDPDPTGIATPQDMADFVARWREVMGQPRFALQGSPVLDDSALATAWTVEVPGVGARSGIDILHAENGRIDHVLSIVGERLFALPATA